MSRLEQEIMDIMPDPVTGFTNSHGVNFTSETITYIKNMGLYCSPNLSVVANHPDFPDDHPAISLELYIDFKLVSDFIAEFEISGIDDLERFTPNSLLELYHRGKAYVFCLYGGNHFCFRKKGNELLVSDYGSKELPILDALITDRDFVEYTKRHHF
jgi:hypothetical protein